MKKEEALEKAQKSSELLCDYITQILADTGTFAGQIEINKYKINNESMCIFYIHVPQKNFEKCINTGVTTDHINILTGQILTEILKHFLKSQTIVITPHYIKDIMFSTPNNQSIDGFELNNCNNGFLTINFIYTGNLYKEQIKSYDHEVYSHMQEEKNKKQL